MRDVLSRASRLRSAPYHPIEDYAVIGGLHMEKILAYANHIGCLPRRLAPLVRPWGTFPRC